MYNIDNLIVFGSNIIMQDSVEPHQVLEVLKRSEEKFRSLVELAPDGIITMNMEGVITSINSAFTELTGFSKDEIVGKHFTRVGTIRERDVPKYLKLFSAFLLGKQMAKYEFAYLRKDGTQCWAEAHASLLKEDGKNIGFLAILRDITERKNMKAELRQCTQHLEKLVNEKTTQLREAQRMITIGETAAMVGHDLRNPLQAIVNTIYLTKMTLRSLPIEVAEKDALEKYLGTVDKQVQYMNKIVTNLLDYTRPIHPEPMNTNINELIAGTLPAIDVPENIEIHLLIPTDFWLMVDPVLIRRVFTNLITNASQAMPDGGTLRLSASKTGKDVFINVEDTGVGIHEENMSKLFEPLFTTKSKGQGFGLPVCKRIIDAHGGEIIVKSEMGKGCIFTVKIPRNRIEK